MSGGDVSRRKEIRNHSLRQLLGWSLEVDEAVRSHIDQGRTAKAESREVTRAVLESLCRRHLGDKVVFLDTGTFPLPRERDLLDGDPDQPPKNDDRWAPDSFEPADSGKHFIRQFLDQGSHSEEEPGAA